LVPQAFPLACTFYKAGNIDELDGSRDHDVGAGNLPEHFQARIGNGYHAHIGLDGTKRIIGRFRLSIASDSIEQCRLSDVGQTDNSSSKHLYRITDLY